MVVVVVMMIVAMMVMVAMVIMVVVAVMFVVVLVAEISTGIDTKIDLVFLLALGALALIKYWR